MIDDGVALIPQTCSFCLSAPTVTSFQWSRRVIAPSLPMWVQDALAISQEQACGACTACAVCLRNRDGEALLRSAYLRFDSNLQRSHDVNDNIWAKILLQTALLNQAAYWASMMLVPDRAVDLAPHLDPGFKAYFAIVSVGVFDHRTSTLHLPNGTRLGLFCNNFVLLPETLISDHRGQGHASAVLQLIVAAADRFRCGIEMIAQPFAIEGAAIGLGQDELIAWYGRHGFTHAPDIVNHPGALRRMPGSFHDAHERFERARARLEAYE